MLAAHQRHVLAHLLTRHLAGRSHASSHFTLALHTQVSENVSALIRGRVGVGGHLDSCPGQPQPEIGFVLAGGKKEGILFPFFGN